ncbi:unnamed protein product [Taenia asiatica]|uniref:Uncharacterized protein n=1 Tax=Taenia asiatica TaxID=60517 RepID=A0A0R3VZE8_TAEAS|nr:unnamed protein product [Taenia asiatica]
MGVHAANMAAWLPYLVKQRKYPSNIIVIEALNTWRLFGSALLMRLWEGVQTKSDEAAWDLMCDVGIADTTEVSADDFVVCFDSLYLFEW